MTHKQAVLKLLSDHKPHSHHELYALGCVAHSRISDLRRDGHKIRRWQEDGLYLYQLEGRLDETTAGSDRCGTDSGTVVSSSASSNQEEHGVTLSVVPHTRPSQLDGDALPLFECDVDESAGLRGAYWDDAA